jgi:GcrA cell cycle regulator
VIATPPEGPGLVHDMRQLGAHACKWPIGDPKEDSFSFCGRPAEGRYCTAHERVGVRAGTAWRSDRDPVVKRALAGPV